MPRLTDGDRDILRELERDARELAPDPDYTEEEMDAFAALWEREVRLADEEAADAFARWIRTSEETTPDDGPPW